MATQSLAAGDPPIVNIGTVVQANLQGHSMALVAAVQSQYDFMSLPGRVSLGSTSSKERDSASPVSDRLPTLHRAFCSSI